MIKSQFLLFICTFCFVAGAGRGDHDSSRSEKQRKEREVRNRLDRAEEERERNLSNKSSKSSDLGSTVATIGVGIGAGYIAKRTVCAKAQNWGCAAAMSVLASVAFATASNNKRKSNEIGVISDLVGQEGILLTDRDDDFCEGDSYCREHKKKLDRILERIDNGEREICIGEENSRPCLLVNEDGMINQVVLKEGGGEKPTNLQELEKKTKDLMKRSDAQTVTALANKKNKFLVTKAENLAKALEQLKRKEAALNSSLSSNPSLEERDLIESEGLKNTEGRELGSGKEGRELGSGKEGRASFRNLLAQFRNSKKKKIKKQKSVSLGEDEIGISQDNIFFMVHRRYKERDKAEQFIQVSSATPHRIFNQ